MALRRLGGWREGEERTSAVEQTFPAAAAGSRGAHFVLAQSRTDRLHGYRVRSGCRGEKRCIIWRGLRHWGHLSGVYVCVRAVWRVVPPTPTLLSLPRSRVRVRARCGPALCHVRGWRLGGY